MTLHLWMHWFWVTVFTLNAVCWAMPPESSDKYNAETKSYQDEDGLAITETPMIESPNERIGKFIVFTQKPTTSTAEFTKPHTIVNPYPQSSDMPDVGGEFVQRESIATSPASTVNKSVTLKEVKNVSALHFAVSNISKINNVKPLDEALVPGNYSYLNNEHPINTTNYVPNMRQVSITYSNNETSISNEYQNNKEQFANKSVSTENEAKAVNNNTKEDNITEEPLSLETTIDVQHVLSSLQGVEPTKGKITLAAASIEDQLVGGSIDTAAVAGISFAALVLVALTGATSFVLYRRRYLNKPQTLNDKCSNADSSGYIDDSTIRENSEEMYSLDNDSFLNSLEAMTIQNYWTDTVKHTKL